MRITVLFDLDDTLIGNNMDAFLKVYLKELSQFIPNIAPQKFINDLLTATGKMAANQSPTSTLEEVFDQAFYPAIGQAKEELGEKIHHFYEQIFPTFKYLTQPRPEAISLVESIMQKGYEVVIATNPLFPKMATLHRLNWAGLPADRYSFEIITTYEDFHFAKPNPAYFAEILARLGCPSNPVVMIGNSWEDDIIPAEKLGLPTFWLNGAHQANSAAPRHCLSQTGQLADIPAWLDSIAGQAVDLPALQPDALLAALIATPAAFDFYKRKLTDQHWQISPLENSWSLLEITCHLRDTEVEIYSPRLQKLITEENPYFASIDPRDWAEIRSYRSQDWRLNLEQFVIERLNSLQQLSSLPAGYWQRSGHHAEMGPITLLSLVHAIVKHDQEHLNQANQLFKTINRPAV
ncbi:MAG: HAD-IA family hydrolase [Anaerolineae bacterium]|nr:HAD-IA family hydrolase [Anaerolineae bacterium]